MRVSIFTPTNNISYLEAAYQSIKDQAYDEWVVFPNNGCSVEDVPQIIKDDNRTKVIIGDSVSSNIGSIKGFCCEHCSGDILVELDHDDILCSGAIEKIRGVFQKESVVLVYSDCAEFNDSDGSSRVYDSSFGWEHYDVSFQGGAYSPAKTPIPIPYHASIIFYAPNHFRAFRKDAYIKCGGYDPTLSICDDQDLMCRLYLEGAFHHISECLYLYRVHGSNTLSHRNVDIQTKTFDLQKKYIRLMTEAWSNRNELLKIDLGGRFNSPDGYVRVDSKGGDITCDLNGKWPFDDSSVGVVRAYDIIEHLKDPIHTMSEIHRVLTPGGYCFIEVPSTDGRGAWQDPTHVSFWNENSFWYYTDRNLAQYIDNTTIRFKRIILDTYYPSDWHQHNNIPYVRADLVCIKDGIKLMGQDLI